MRRITLLLICACVIPGAVSARGWFPAQQFSAGEAPIAVVEADFDLDGHVDVASANRNSDDLTVLLGRGDGTFHTAGTYAVGDEPTAAAADDFNRDGYVDLAVTAFRSGDVTILMGNGDGTFAAGVAYDVDARPRSLAIDDLDQDGWQDMVTGNRENYVSVLLGNGDGTFRDAPWNTGIARDASWVALGELTGDTYPDLVVVTDVGDDQILVLKGTGDGTFSTIAIYWVVPDHSRAVILSDLDLDDVLDVAITFTTASEPPGVVVGLGQVGGIFSFETFCKDTPSARGIDVGDFDRDGWPDLAVAGIDDVTLMLGQGGGTFSAVASYPVGDSAQSVTHADFDEDGKDDLAATSVGGVTILLGRGDRTFESATRFGDGHRVKDVDLADFDEDGQDDLLATNWSRSDVEVLLGQGDGTFSSGGTYSTLPPGSVPISGARAAVTGDFNEDGNVDVVTLPGTVLLGDGAGSLAFSGNFLAGYGPVSINTDHFYPNGHLDLITVSGSSDEAWVLRGRGTGGFIYGGLFFAGWAPIYGTLGDFNEDGHSDLVTVSERYGRLLIKLGDGDGTFSNKWRGYDVGEGVDFVEVVDVNDDGHLDLVMVNPDLDEVKIMIGAGDGTFEFGPSYSLPTPHSVGSGDVDGDGLVDLLVTDKQGSVTVLLGNGDGTFGEATRYAASRYLSRLVVGDFNGDGWIDIAAGTLPGVAVLTHLGPAGPRAEIDIKPGDVSNDLNPRSRGVIPVALLGNDNFDVAEIDESLLRFGPDAAPIAHNKAHPEDVNADGIMDLVTHYRTPETGIACGDESATLVGETLDGIAFEISDSIRTVGCGPSRRPGVLSDPRVRENEGSVGLTREIQRRE